MKKGKEIQFMDNGNRVYAFDINNVGYALAVASMLKNKYMNETP